MLSTIKTKFFNKFVKNEAGVTAIEYAIVAAGVAAVVLVIFDPTSGPVAQALDDVFAALSLKLTSLLA